MKSALAAAILSLALTGCAAGTHFTYDEARQVHTGMTEAQVLEIMGRPYQVISRTDGQMWIWSYASTLGGAKVVILVLNDGKVSKTPEIPTSFQ